MLKGIFQGFSLAVLTVVLVGCGVGSSGNGAEEQMLVEALRHESSNGVSTFQDGTESDSGATGVDEDKNPEALGKEITVSVAPSSNVQVTPSLQPQPQEPVEAATQINIQVQAQEPKQEYVANTNLSATAEPYHEQEEYEANYNLSATSQPRQDSEQAEIADTAQIAAKPRQAKKGVTTVSSNSKISNTCEVCF